MTGPAVTGEQAWWPAAPVRRARWPILVAVGVAWLLFAMVLLQFDFTSAWAIAISAGLLLIAASLGELINAMVTPGWRWMHATLAAGFFVGGIIALVWQEPTFLALARVVAWVLFFKGCADFVLALGRRGEDALWWLRLAIGALEIAIAFWAAGSVTRSAALLILWISLLAVAKGIADITLAFELRARQRAIEIAPDMPQPEPRPRKPDPTESVG
jgi:uncharacterized membrane protein HdeD (DUF308 family)